MKIKAALVAIALVLPAGSTLAEPFSVAVDHARILRLSRPATAVIVGNPAIADATVFEGNTLFITGKTFGATNFIALDMDGKTIINRTLVVKPADSRLTLHRGSYQQTYLCADGCEPVPSIGDDAESFDRLMDQHQTKAAEGSDAANEN